MLIPILIFIVLPTALIVLAFKIKPLAGQDEPRGDALGGMRAACLAATASRLMSGRCGKTRGGSA